MEARYLFVGEDRSQTAKKAGWSWQWCQENKPRLCAIQLWQALEAIGLDPKIQEFTNLWDDDGKPQTIETDLPVVGMGRRVQKELSQRGVVHIPIPHPAARGEIRKPENYRSAVRLALTRDQAK